MSDPTGIHIFGSPDGIAQHAARTLAEIANGKPGRVAVALSGGETPARLYRHLAEDWGDRIPWERLELFFGDERAVPYDHPDSNFRLASEALLSRVPIPPDQVHPMPAGEADRAAAALRYEEEIHRLVPAGPSGEPAFDLIWLGLGEDGHTASLFPGTAALDDTEDLVAPNFVPTLGAWRMTFTLPLLDGARRVQFLVTGKRKEAAVRRILGPAEDGVPVAPLPAARVRPLYGRVDWLLDRDAALGISEPGLIA